MKKTVKIRKINTKTYKRRKCSFSNKSHIIKKLMEMLNLIKLFHLNTKKVNSYNASENAYKNLSKHVDKFIEIYLAKYQNKMKTEEKTLLMIEYNRSNDFQSKLLEYREILTDLNHCFSRKKDSDLLSIRDEILVDLNQFLYLSSLK